MATSSGGHTGQPRSGRGRFTRSPTTAQRDAKAVAMRAAGATYDQIAQALGFSSRSVARRAVERALVETCREPADALRTLELERLDTMSRRAWVILQGPYPLVSAGRVVTDPATGKPLDDYRPVLAAIDTLLRISERRAKLLGLDAPTKVQALSMDAVDAEIARLTAELGRE